MARTKCRPNASTATGTAFVSYDSMTNTFDIEVEVLGIPLASITGAHIHQGAAGANGPVIFDLGAASFYQDGGSVRRMIANAAFPAANLNDLFTGNTYVNIHTPAFPGGEIRAQLRSSAATARRA